MNIAPGASIAIDSNSTGDIAVIAALAGKKIEVYGIFFVVNAATTITFKDGAGGSSLTGAIDLAQGATFVLDNGTAPWFVTTPGNAFVISQTGTAQISGRVYYIAGP